MSVSEATKSEAQRQYSRGYAAGRKRLKSDMEKERRRATDEEFWDATFQAVSAAAFQCQGWSRGETPITSLNDRVDLAADWADRAVKVRRNRHAKL